MGGGGEHAYLVVLLLVMAGASLTTFRAPDRYYIPISLTFTAAIISLGLADGLSWQEMGLGLDALPSGLLWAGICLVVMVGVYAVGLRVPRLHPLFADRRIQEASGRRIAFKAGLDIPLGTVLLEEIAFRGVLFGMLAVRWGTPTAIACSAALFGLWHILPALSMHDGHSLAETLGSSWRHRLGSVVGTVLATAAAGVAFAGLLVHSGSVVAPMGLHWSMNGLGAAAAWWLGNRTSRGDSDVE